MAKSTVLGIIALIIGASGLGLGVFSLLNLLQVEEGSKGIDYPVSSELEIKNALDAIGTGYGIITITNNITLNGTIEINGGGNYIIQGAGAVIKCTNNQEAFDITNAKSLTIQNIKIDATEVTLLSLNIIRINEANNNPIYIRNVHIIGDSNTTGRGIYILSDNIWVSECYFYLVDYAIWQAGGNRAHIYDNVIDDFSSQGIYLTGANNFVDGNLINNTGFAGIYAESYSHYNSISNNHIYLFDQWGIFIQTDYNIILGNYIRYGVYAGIYVDGDYNIIESNGCYNVVVPTIIIGYGIWLGGGTNNTVVGNTCLFNESPFGITLATNTYVSGNQFF
ncbi:MAG: right-handed parallel beta-helix repeat-containing protein [Candidatus Hodarchaeota archaeon]